MTQINRYRVVCVAFLMVCVLAAARPASAQSCSYAVQPTRLGFSNFPVYGLSPAADSHTVTVTAPAGCTWTAASPLPWVTIASGASGSGTGSVVLDVAENGGDWRVGHVVIAGTDVLLNQSGCLTWRPMTNSLFPGFDSMAFVDATGGRRYVQANPATASCAWPAHSDVPWIVTTPGGSGAGAGIVEYSVQPNASGTAREGTITVGYLSYTIHQFARAKTDMNGDFAADLLWQHRTTGQIATWLMNGLNLMDGRLLTPSQVTDTDWQIVGSGDFNQDGQYDLVWQHADGRISLWKMDLTSLVDGALFVHQISPANPDWRVRAVADLNGDGRPDVVLHNRVTGDIKLWIMFGTSLVSEAQLSPASVPDTNWQIVGAADFDFDNQVDLLWQNQSNGMISVWTLDALRTPFATEGFSKVVRAGTLLNPGQVAETMWKIRAVADIDGDGQADLIWQNQSSGLISTWFMNGITLREGTLFSPDRVLDTDWVIVGPR